ncbi:MAG: HAMP domain-containing sensor histidine kinase, partial [Verrucomicrobiota bacterium]
MEETPSSSDIWSSASPAGAVFPLSPRDPSEIMEKGLRETVSRAEREAVVLVDRSLTPVFSNQKFRSLWEIPEKEATRDNLLSALQNSLIVPEGMKERFEEIESGEAGDFTEILKLKNGRIFSWANRPLDGDGWSWSLFDVTEKIRHETILNFLSEELWEKKGDAYCEAIARTSGDLLKFPHVLIATREGDDQLKPEIFLSHGEIKEVESLSISDSPADRVFKERFVRIESEARRQYPDDPFLAAHEVESWFSMPLRNSGGEAFGFLAMMDEEKRMLTYEHFKLLKIMSVRLAGELQIEAHSQQAPEEVAAEPVVPENNPEEVRALFRSREEFVGRMSHEFRTSLNAILGFSQLMSLDENMSPDHQETLQIIRASGENLIEAVSDFVDISLIDGDAPHFNWSTIDLGKLLESVFNRFRSD